MEQTLKGGLQELIKSGNTGSKIHLGVYKHDKMLGFSNNGVYYMVSGRVFFLSFLSEGEEVFLNLHGFRGNEILNAKIGLDGLYIRSKDDFYFFEEGESEKVKLMSMEGVSDWQPDSKGLYVLKGKEFFLLNEVESISLGMYEFNSWMIGPKGIYFEKDRKFYIVKDKVKKPTEFGKNQYSDWKVGSKGLYIITEDNDIILLEENNNHSYSLRSGLDVSKIHFTEKFDLRVKTDGFYLIKENKKESLPLDIFLANQEYDEYDVGSLGVYVRRKNEFFIILVKDDDKQ